MLVRYGAFVEERTNIDRKSFSLNLSPLPKRHYHPFL
jgi:hypothetical protein